MGHSGWGRRALLIFLFSLAIPSSATAQPPRSHKHVCGPVPARFVRCHAEVVTNANTGAPLVTSGPSGYGPSDLQSAYGLGAMSAPSGSAETVAIVDAYDDPNAQSDLGVYRSQYGLAPCTTANGCFRKVNETGGSTYPSANSSWDQEISLDLDMVSAICPSCHILLVEANSARITDLGTAENTAASLGATQISNSYGGGEYSGETTDESSYYHHPGIAITVSAGDNGYGVEFPAASQYVTAIGGTSLKRDSSARGWSETAWSRTGSGCSAYIAKPSWQTDSGCTMRTVSDVSADANPNTGVAVYDSVPYQAQSGWLEFGGTSVASPIVASFDALIGSPAASAQYHYGQASLYNDVTSGSNGACIPTYLCTAGAGYDGPTGVGSIEGRPAPVVTTGAATGISTSAATVSGTVNPNGLSTSYHFDYGTTTGYGQQSPATDQSVGYTDTSSHAVSTSLTGLSAGTTYHFRLVATSSAGTSYGQDQSFTTTAASYSSAVMSTPGLQHYWRLGDGSGTTANDSGGSANGTYKGGVTLAQPGAIAGDPDTSAAFDGSSGYVSLPSLGSASNFTVEGWTKLTSAAANNPYGDNTLYGWSGHLRVIVRPTGIYAGAWIGGTEYAVQAGTANNIGNWVHWALVGNGSQLTVYRNGTAIGSTSIPTGNVNLGGTIGAYSGSSLYLNGTIDEVALYNTALDQTTIQQHYQLGSSG